MPSPPDHRPAFHSHRLLAEPVEPRHASAMARVLDDPRIFRHLDEEPPTEAQLRRRYAFLQHGRSPDETERWLTWILRPADSGTVAEPLGFVQATIRRDVEAAAATPTPLVADIAYVLAPAHWGRGLGREAVTALLDTVFATWPVARAVAEIDVDNRTSIRLVSDLGWTFVRTQAPDGTGADARPPELVYSITAADWARRRTAPKPDG